MRREKERSSSDVDMVPREAPFVWRSSTIPALRGLPHVMTLNWKHSYRLLLMTSPPPHKRTTQLRVTQDIYRKERAFAVHSSLAVPVIYEIMQTDFRARAISVSHVFSIRYASTTSETGLCSYLNLRRSSTALSLRRTAHQGSRLPGQSITHPDTCCLCSYPHRADGERRGMKGGRAAIKAR